MHGKNRLDLVRAVGFQRVGDPVEVEGRFAPEVDQVHLGPEARSGIRPAVAEPPHGGHQHRVPRRDHIGERRFPSGVTVADIDRGIVAGPCHAAQIIHQPRHHVDQRSLVDIRRRAVHRLKNRVGNDRRAGDGQIGATVGQGGFVGHRARPRKLTGHKLIAVSRVASMSDAMLA